jgi:hypothetical protein
MSQLLFVDIETVGNPVMEQFLKPPQAPKNYKDPQKIAAYVANKQADQVSRMALDIDYARIVSIAIGRGFKGEPEVRLAGSDKEEAEVLTWFWENLVGAQLSAQDPSYTLFGYNLVGYDLPIILRRSWVLKVSTILKFNTHPRNRQLVDLMRVLYHDGYAPGPKFKGLKAVCEMYQIPNDMPDVDGSMVSDMVEHTSEGIKFLDPEKLKAYNASDVRMTQQLAQKTEGWYWSR